ncbi:MULTISPECIES: precorrin-2 dehydrogenase/sirohydrochlorin ferrochelatase family protein [Staphylococcus]|jgi:precorrin-2 dehydrogenase/sirohydrochlorin ferrochelatase|uniref:precorrin-2 dehydrogenase n=1 Tax=Staphylococcus nepalensis TaxID=214473 RepID=A0A291JIM5_9STAP|nr:MULTISPECIES: NAD(P)-dependent oxidoreductase [Staphylococcus]VDG66267.1 siroheme synthase [Lacrimispora indolis]ATH59343.1 preprotein translocase subunit TatB [Staphylococcus nepalensis]ATH64435.1 preprotein translocase subunit TatB [Staphylococcus nepalensis]MBO1205655.1 bifunctional precorrin-2 dehydrogenase/sirohydrochlorin ferrochelatase [Staphylococcus nepalensis]MBO1212681.1 bifunctional precorrin-2 dehydrogenase/sirohydrochlorin ferrochelatase [Staphylococcus nepalensis]
MYPIQLNLADKQVVIIGGGKIAYRKFQQLVNEDIISLTIISKTFLPEFFETEHPNLKLITKTYDSKDIKKADMIIIATNDTSVNNQVKKDALPHQLVNHTGDKTQSDFYNMPEIQYHDLKILFRSNGTDYNKVKKVSHAVQQFLAEVYEEDKHV